MQAAISVEWSIRGCVYGISQGRGLEMQDKTSVPEIGQVVRLKDIDEKLVVKSVNEDAGTVELVASDGADRGLREVQISDLLPGEDLSAKKEPAPVEAVDVTSLPELDASRSVEMKVIGHVQFGGEEVLDDVLA